MTAREGYGPDASGESVGSIYEYTLAADVLDEAAPSGRKSALPIQAVRRIETLPGVQAHDRFDVAGRIAGVRCLLHGLIATLADPARARSPESSVRPPAPTDLFALGRSQRARGSAPRGPSNPALDRQHLEHGPHIPNATPISGVPTPRPSAQPRTPTADPSAVPSAVPLHHLRLSAKDQALHSPVEPAERNYFKSTAF